MPLLINRGIKPNPGSGIAFDPADSAYPDLFDSLTFAIAPEIASACRFIDFSGRNNAPAQFPAVARYRGNWGHNHPSTGSRTLLGAMDDLVPLSNITICTGWEKTDSTQRNSGVFGSSGLTSSQYCNMTPIWSDGKTYWQWGATFISDGTEATFSAIDYTTCTGVTHLEGTFES